MTIKRTFANVGSISDRHVLALLPLFDLETSDPLFDGELSPVAANHCWVEILDRSLEQQTQVEKTVERLPPGKPLTAIEPTPALGSTRD